MVAREALQLIDYDILSDSLFIFWNLSCPQNFTHHEGRKF